MPAGIITGKEAFREVVLKESWHYFLLWNKLYRAEIFEGLRLREDFIHEDEEIAGRLLCSCGNMAVTDERLYVYVKRGDSLINIARGMPVNRIRTFREMIIIDRERAALLEKIGMNDEAYYYSRMSPYGRALSVLSHVNFLQHRKKISAGIFSVLKTLASSKEIKYKLRAVKLILKMARSMFRPFTKRA